MTGLVTSLWRHPIKSHGREALGRVMLAAGKTMPGDRIWAVAHEVSKADNTAWAPCVNFSRGSKAPGLMAITAILNDETGRVRLTHPTTGSLEFAPEAEEQAFLNWVAPLMPSNRAASARLVRVPGRGMTDTDYPSITLCNMASHRAVERQLGQSLSIHRWRGNFWFDGLPAWEEFNWVDQEVQVGEAVLKIVERAARCAATTANPETGLRDADTLGALRQFGHQDFSVYAKVLRGGRVQKGDKVQVL